MSFSRNGSSLLPKEKTSSHRQKNAKIAEETMFVCDAGKYTSPNGQVVDISKSLRATIDNSCYYPGDKTIVSSLTELTPVDPTVEVVNETTAQTAMRLLGQSKTNLVALNFAAACNPGGGFTGGAQAQEEDLCRASGLYPCLRNKPLYYNANVLCDNRYYTDGIIYSPNVPFFRDVHNMFLEEPFTLSIITAPAPNQIGGGLDADKVRATFKERIRKILKVAQIQGHANLILGAWGCGAFCNDPTMVAGLFRDALKKMKCFEHVCFAVYDTREPPTVFNTFKEYF